MSLENDSLKQNIMPPTFHSADTLCDFESGTICNRCTQSLADDADFFIGRGNVGSSQTGPNYDHTTGNGKFGF